MNTFAHLSLRMRLIGMLAITTLLICVLALLSAMQEHDTLMQERHNKIRGQVESAVSLVSSFEQQAASGALAPSLAQHLALNALTRMRFDGKEYFFVLDPNLRYLAHGVNAHLIGKDLHGISDKTGINMGALYDQVLRDGNGKGFASFVWDKPGSASPQPKLAYLMITPGWHWVVVTGLYMDDINAAFNTRLWQMGLICALALALLFVVGWRLLCSVNHMLGAEPETLITEVRHIADSRLDRPIKTGAGNSHSVLAAVASMREQLRSLVQEIANGSNNLSQMGTQLAHSAAQMANSSGEQSSAAGNMAAAIEQLTVSVTRIASHAQQAQTISQESGERSHEGGRVIVQAMEEMQSIHAVVTQAATAISALTDETRSIASIMAVIKEVADQTNLLALNAAIEAARAGEHGRGFAVVADEVRRLSERTTRATDEIARMIEVILERSNTSQTQMGIAVQRVEHGLSLAGNGNDAIARIQDSNGQVIAVVNEISSALREQAGASHDIAQQVESIASNTARNAETAGTVSNSVRDMQGMASRQQDLVKRFIL